MNRSFLPPVLIFPGLHAAVNVRLVLIDHPVPANLAGGFETAAQGLAPDR